MATEDLKSVRLKKAATEFNIGLATIVEFLSKKGHKIDNNPNTKLTEEMYQLLLKEFQSEKAVKEESMKIGLDISQKKAITIEETAKPKEDEREEEELSIKDLTMHVAKQNLQKETAEKEIKEAQAKEENVQEEKIEKPSKSKKKEKVEEIEEPAAPVSGEISTADITVKITGKIDLEDLNQKTKPTRKTKEEKDREREEKKQKELAEKEARREELKKEKEAKTEAERQEKEAKKKKTQEEAVVEQTVVEVIESQPEIESPEKEEKVDNFIKTEYQKLDGPKIVEGLKIDLSQFEKPKKAAGEGKKEGENSSKKKRKRIDKTPKPVVDNHQPAKDKPDWKDKKKGAPVKKAPVEIDAGEIEKQIKETLARLNVKKKSDGSKHRREKRSMISQQMQEEQLRQEEDQKILKVTEFVTANELASMMNVPVTKVIATCMMLGMMVSINQRLDAEALNVIADEFGYKISFVSADVVEAISDVEEEDNPEDLEPRAPIVTVMGHVDHGKTSLLDYIRNTNVIAGEAGGITQHIGSYEVAMEDGRKITFLDTPGHEAFTAMRARGAKITDIAIIVVAADDRIMPQTKEAINHAQAANVPIIFAINKIDKPAANPEKIKEELAAMNFLVEDWGGKYQSQDISAKKGLHVKELMEKVLLEAELLDLKGNPQKRAKGTIIESSLDKGRGYIAKILVQDGTIKIGDMVLAGSTYGRVKAMYNERNQAVKEAGPSSPILLLGLNGAPQAGDTFNVMENEKDAKDIATKRTQLQREQGIRTQKHITLDEIGRRIAIGDFKQLDLIVKGDVDGSVEALADSLLKLSTEEVQVNVLHKSVGQITESDVMLATASNAIIIGFQVRPSVGARKLAEAEQIDIRLYSIIYNAINELKDAIEGMLSPEIQEKIVCNLEIREIFKMAKVGTIAGCMCLDGKINRQTKVRIIRDGIVVYTGKLESLRRFKDDVKEVVVGQDCGLNIENFNDIKVGDIVEGYEETEVKRKL